MPRPKIIEITVKVELPDGSTQTIPVKPDIMAIFFTDVAVEKMLGIFYKNEPGHYMKRSESLTAFEQKITDEVFGPPDPANPTPENDEIELTPAVIDQIWNAENKSGLGLPMLGKIPPCIIC